MNLPNPSLELKPSNKVVVFVHHLIPSLNAEELDKCRSMDHASLEAAQAIPGHLGHEFASTDQGTVFMSYWENDEALALWAQHPCTKKPNDWDTSCGTRRTGQWCARWDATGSQTDAGGIYQMCAVDA